MNSEEHSSFFIINSSLNKMDTIELQQTLPEVFAGRDGIVSDVWHRQVAFQKGKMYLIEAASGTGKSSLCSFIYGYRTDYQGIITFDGENVRKLTVDGYPQALAGHAVSGTPPVRGTDGVGERAAEERADGLLPQAAGEGLV